MQAKSLGSLTTVGDKFSSGDCGLEIGVQNDHEKPLYVVDIYEGGLCRQ